MGELHAIAVPDEYVTISNQKCTHAGFGIDSACKLLAQSENDVFFLYMAARRARILAAVACIDCDNDIAAGLVAL